MVSDFDGIILQKWGRKTIAYIEDYYVGKLRSSSRLLAGQQPEQVIPEASNSAEKKRRANEN